MADIQRQFEQFHERIRVDYDMSQELRDKRDIIVSRIKKHLKEQGRPTTRELLQGSYRMKTGVKPIADLEYDIDIGLRFNVDDHEDATTVRGWVFDAVKDHTMRCENRTSCIRVVYQAGFHLDLVTYRVTEDGTGVETFHLAHKTNGWRLADPVALLEHIDTARKRFEGTNDNATQTDQFRRVVRYLRRWADVQEPLESDAKPTGLAFVLLCCVHLTMRRFIDDRPDDRAALEQFCRLVGSWLGRLVATKPTPDYEDVLARLTDGQMETLKRRFLALADALTEAGRTVDPVRACELLRPHLGDDFPVPTPEDSGKKTKAPAIITSSASA